ncbi:Dopey, N-terminal-domain-containing protein [Lineolata rhizophorae]|uniref:Dopey, N-terminal-domain-containing protein n=1 Tax=Lineolata rhizophorae TaxID=578093 RepID=A0A6A6P6Z5_9PEZI|nr:Dopey, N-terminal-domain-containing protein [Lineolata rhizophorae]
MSLDPLAQRPAISPASSGRASPVARQLRRGPEYGVKDKTFRRYASGVERALLLFDTTEQEWADYISFLGRLLKALQARTTTNIGPVPHKALVSQRLAQCLNPSLPSGVHQKALEVYGFLFSMMGKDNLAKDLHLFFPGLAPTLSFASLSVRPAFLSLFEDFVLPLDFWVLRPALKSIILSLLPALEEESAEDFDRVFKILVKLKEAVRENREIGSSKIEQGDSTFWQCFFLAAITNQSRRPGALAFLMRSLPKLGPLARRQSSAGGSEDEPNLPPPAEGVISPEPGLLVRAFTAGLEDQNLLIQRGFLDLLVTHLPLDSPVLQKRIRAEDLQRLVGAAAGVVARRDMSLNRRLWTWFLGPDPPADEENGQLKSPASGQNARAGDLGSYHAAYFARFGCHPLTRSILAMINKPSSSAPQRARPLRICLSLMDRWEVGGLLVPEIFIPALESVYQYGEISTKSQLDEVLRSTSNFFDGVESGLIWGKVVELMTTSLRPGAENPSDRLKRLKLVRFIITNFNLREEEMLLCHIPLAALTILSMLSGCATSKRRAANIDNAAIELAFSIADSLIQLLHERAFRQTKESAETPAGLDKVVQQTVLTRISDFYVKHDGNLEASPQPFEPQVLSLLLLRECTGLFSDALCSNAPRGILEHATKTLCSLVHKLPGSILAGKVELLPIFLEVLGADEEPGNDQRDVSFPVISAVATTLAAFQETGAANPVVPPSEMPPLIHSMVSCLWRYLSPVMPKYHVETVRVLWQLQALTPAERHVEASITALMSTSVLLEKNGPEVSAEAGRRFAVIWSHTMHEQEAYAEKSGRNSRRRSAANTALTMLAGSINIYQLMLTRPLVRTLDALAEEETELFAFVKTWLRDLPSLNRVFWVVAVHLSPLLQHQSESETEKSSSTKDSTTTSIKRRQWQRASKDYLYWMQTLSRILKWASDYTWATIASNVFGVRNGAETDNPELPLPIFFARVCVQAFELSLLGSFSGNPIEISLQRSALAIIRQILLSPCAETLGALHLDDRFISILIKSVDKFNPALQSSLLQVILAAFHARAQNQPAASTPEGRLSSRDGLSASTGRSSITKDSDGVDSPLSSQKPPSQLVDCLRVGFSSPSNRVVLDDWVNFLSEVFPVFPETMFQNLLPLIECFCAQIKLAFGQLQATFQEATIPKHEAPESTLISLMNGLEQTLARAHERLLQDEAKSAASKSPEQPQGFFGNMVSGVFSSDVQQTRSATANSRLSVLLCFQDTVRMCFEIWSWGGYGRDHLPPDPTSFASFNHTALRMRNRARRILEHLFAAETLECLETLVSRWRDLGDRKGEHAAIFGLLNVLNGSRPKNTIPTIFNAIYGRTHPGSLDALRVSTLTSDLTDSNLALFLVEYTRSLEDDAMDEIWADCIAFLRDVLANPMPHRQVLPVLIEFTATLAEKVDNTNFGDQRKLRKELGDIFLRLLAASFTSRSLSFLQEPSVHHNSGNSKLSEKASRDGNFDILPSLATVAPTIPLVLGDNDRVANAVAGISTSILGPAMRAKVFPENVSSPLLDLLSKLSHIPQASKIWKRDISEAFSDARFFSTPLDLVKDYWIAILHEWILNDRDRIPELLSRLSPPTTAGIMFGVGATSARTDADRRTQLNLRRTALLVVAAPDEAVIPNLSGITEKLAELLTATTSTSPSSATRAEVFLLLRALVIKLEPVHLAALWPIIDNELRLALLSLLPDDDAGEVYNSSAVVHASKMLDVLVALEPDEFQLHEWVFITDTIDAVYRPPNWQPTAIVDDLAEALSNATTSPLESHAFALPAQPASTAESSEPSRRPLLDRFMQDLDAADVKAMPKQELTLRVLRPYMGQLSISAFEATYSASKPDRKACMEGLVKDLFDIGGL